MRGSYNAYATRKLTQSGEKQREPNRTCRECAEKSKDIAEKDAVILTLQKKIERLRNDLMNCSIDYKANENKINDLVSMLAKCQYEKQKGDEEIKNMKKLLNMKKNELTKSKDDVLDYKEMYKEVNKELSEKRELMKKETLLSNKELKKMNKELLENKIIQEKKNLELEDTRKTVTNLNTMVGDLQYIVQRLLLDAQKGPGKDDKDEGGGGGGSRKSSNNSQRSKKNSGPMGNAKQYLEFTKKSYDLRQKAREKVDNHPKVDFVFADVNCNLCLRLRDGTFVHFSSEEELDEIMKNLDSGD